MHNTHNVAHWYTVMHSLITVAHRCTLLIFPTSPYTLPHTLLAFHYALLNTSTLSCTHCYTWHTTLHTAMHVYILNRTPFHTPTLSYTLLHTVTHVYIILHTVTHSHTTLHSTAHRYTRWRYLTDHYTFPHYHSLPPHRYTSTLSCTHRCTLPHYHTVPYTSLHTSTFSYTPHFTLTLPWECEMGCVWECRGVLLKPQRCVNTLLLKPIFSYKSYPLLHPLHCPMYATQLSIPLHIALHLYAPPVTYSPLQMSCILTSPT